MKRIYSNIMPCLLLAGMAVTTACTNSEEEPMLQVNADNVLKIETCIAETRDVVTGTEFQKGDQIGLYVFATDGHDYTSNSINVCATYSGSEWSLNRDIVMGNEEANIYAYYPYNKTNLIHNDSTVISISPTTSGQLDYMVSSCKGVSQKQTTAKLTFKHVLARVTLAITKGATDVGKGKISKIRIENDTLFQGVQTTSGFIYQNKGKVSLLSTKGIMSLKDGGITRVYDKDAYIETNLDCTINEKETMTVDFLIIPCSSLIKVNHSKGGDLCVIITIDGAEYKASLGAAQWDAGQQYTIPIIINRETDYSNIPGEKVYMGFNGDNGKPLYWSSYNLGATAPEEEGGYYGWGDPTGTHTEQCLFNGEEYEQYADTYMADEDECMKLYGGVNPPSNISGTEYDTARALWGSGWRIPSKNEFALLRDNCKRERTTLNGVDGYQFTSYKNGNTIFMPYTTRRIGNIILPGGDSECGQYWTSTFYGLTIAYSILLAKMDDNYNSGLRCVGYSIRPITE